MDDLQTPPTEAEVADLCSRLPSAVGGIVRRLAFQRDTLAARVRELEAGMTWTDAKPTELWRWYYWRRGPTWAYEFVFVEDDGFVWVRGRRIAIDKMPGQFAGPIPVPVEPTEERK